MALWSVSSNSWFLGTLQWLVLGEFITTFVILLFLSLWLFCNSPFLWSCIMWYIFWDSPHVVSFHLHFLQIEMVMPYHLTGLNIVARFFNDMFYVSSTPCHYAHVFVMVLHNNILIFLKSTIVNDNEMCITLNYLQIIIFHDNVKYNSLFFTNHNMLWHWEVQ